MRFSISSEFQSHILAATREAMAEAGMVNVPVVAMRVHSSNLHENVALEDIELRVLQAAQMFRAAIEFDRSSPDEIDFMPHIGAIVTVVPE